MGNYVIRDLVLKISGGFFSIICDEYTDIINKEQLTICIRWVDKELEAHEDFLGFYNVPEIGAETIMSAIKDVLLKLQLSLVNGRGQCDDIIVKIKELPNPEREMIKEVITLCKLVSLWLCKPGTI